MSILNAGQLVINNTYDELYLYSLSLTHSSSIDSLTRITLGQVAIVVATRLIRHNAEDSFLLLSCGRMGWLPSAYLTGL